MLDHVRSWTSWKPRLRALSVPSLSIFFVCVSSVGVFKTLVSQDRSLEEDRRSSDGASGDHGSPSVMEAAQFIVGSSSGSDSSDSDSTGVRSSEEDADALPLSQEDEQQPSPPQTMLEERMSLGAESSIADRSGSSTTDRLSLGEESKIADRLSLGAESRIRLSLADRLSLGETIRTTIADQLGLALTYDNSKDLVLPVVCILVGCFSTIFLCILICIILCCWSDDYHERRETTVEEHLDEKYANGQKEWFIGKSVAHLKEKKVLKTGEPLAEKEVKKKLEEIPRDFFSDGAVEGEAEFEQKAFTVAQLAKFLSLPDDDSVVKTIWEDETDHLWVGGGGFEKMISVPHFCWRVGIFVVGGDVVE